MSVHGAGCPHVSSGVQQVQIAIPQVQDAVQLIANCQIATCHNQTSICKPAHVRPAPRIPNSIYHQVQYSITTILHVLHVICMPPLASA